MLGKQIFLNKGNTQSRVVHNRYFLRMHGQSNSEGIKPVDSLAITYRRTFRNVYIWWNPTEGVSGGSWENLKARKNNQRSTSAAGSDRLQWYGAEIAIADLFEREHPNDVLYISKYAVGGSSVAVQAGTDWNIANTGEALDIAIDNYNIPAKAALSAYTVTDLGMIWMQGEQDAAHATDSATATFRTNTLNTFSDFRTRESVASMPIYVCRLNAAIDRDPTRLSNVRTAQGTTSGNLTDTGTNPNNHFFDTDSYPIISGDTVHFEQFDYGVALYTAVGL